MGAAFCKARSPGTGSVHQNGRKLFVARLPPERGEHEGQVVGRFETMWHAHRALDRLLEQRRKAG